MSSSDSSFSVGICQYGSQRMCDRGEKRTLLLGLLSGRIGCAGIGGGSSATSSGGGTAT
jgi:hypothetical protein